jgi:multiple antibiotic resistance protein
MDHSTWDSFVLTFVPLFIVLDALGTLPFVLALSEDMSIGLRRRTIHIAVLTAGVVGLAFLFFGRFILDVLDIDIGSFAIAGGLILLALSIKYLTTGRWVEIVREEMVAVVPIGTPLLAGPATITTLLLLDTQFPLYMVLVSFILNIAISWAIFLLGSYITKFLGRGGLHAVSNIFNLLLAAIAVSMIIKGLSLLGVIDIGA